MFDNEKKMMDELDNLGRENTDKKIEMDQLTMAYNKLNDDMKFLIDSNEAEVSLRLQFEAKLNSLHALHRDLQAKYDRAKEEIYSLETEKTESKTTISA